MRSYAPLLYSRPYNAFPMLEASGAKAGHPEDASATMPRYIDGSNQSWAWNAMMREWQIPHTIKTGNTLFKLSGIYYGASSLDGVHAIYAVPQNKAIQGSSPDSGLIPGDVILIPGLPQPKPAPSTSDSNPLAFPDVPPTGPLATIPPGGMLPVPVPTSAPESWPTGEQFPPSSGVGDDGTVVLDTVTVEGTVPSGAGKPAPESFWTTGRIVAASAVGAVGIGTLIYLASKKKRRRRAA